MREPLSQPAETIVACATPSGRGGIAILRVSGPLTKSIAENLLKKIPAPRFATYASFLDATDTQIDEGIALFFPGPHSFTGEDVLEIQGHGSPVLVDLLIQRIVALGARIARPGEFSERAFLNNKMDLIQAEAVADLISASSMDSARAAIRSLQGEFSKKIKNLLDTIIQLRTYIEAAIDFVEEEIDFLKAEAINQKLMTIRDELHAIDMTAQQGSLLREGLICVIAGPPNVGKSSLLNCLSGKETAIVTSIAGTTRDVLRESILMDGLSLQFIDTAGLRQTTNVIEQEGIRRAEHEINQADLVIWVKDDLCQEFQIHENMPKPALQLFIRNKIDKTSEIPKITIDKEKTIIHLSAKTGEGISLLKDQIKTMLGLKKTNEGIFSARRRHLEILDRIKKLINNSLQLFSKNQAIDLLAEDLRQAQLALNEMTGEFSSDDLLGRIFSTFCVGK